MRVKQLITLLFLASCANSGKYATLKIDNPLIPSQFSFTVLEDFVRKNYKSSPDKSHSKMSKAEAKLLKKLLKKQQICPSGFFTSPKFEILSRQEQVYDVTFARLIAQNYNARPAVPRIYKGQCVY